MCAGAGCARDPQMLPGKVREAMMEIATTRFGSLKLEAGDVLNFPEGLPGLDELQDWVLLADTKDSELAWMQSTTRADVALAVVSPRRFVPQYRVRVTRRELAPLSIEQRGDAQVLVIVGRGESGLYLNLKAPLVINPRIQVGRQVVTRGDIRTSDRRQSLGKCLTSVG